jgi:hypothetical protein
MQLRQPALQHPPCLLQDVFGASVHGAPGAVLHLQLYVLRLSLCPMRNLQVARVLGSQWRVQHMQQKGVQQLFTEKRTHKEQDNLPRLLCALEQFSSLLKSALNNRSS